jgi:voltage-gated potassium channel
MTHRRTEVQLFLSLAVLLLVAGAGTVGYMLTEHLSPFEAVYQTLIVLSTLGIRDFVHSRAGDWITVCLILGGVGSVGYAFTLLVSLFVEGHLQSALGRIRMDTKIARLRKHFIVCGYGEMGQMIADELRRSNGTDVVVVEKEPPMRLLASNRGILSVLGDCHEEAVLKAAGVEQAAGLAAVLPGDADNVFVVLTARAMNPGLTIVSRGDRPETVAKMKRAGATHVVSPHASGASRMASLLTHPAVADFLEIASHDANVDMETLEVDASSSLAGASLRDADLHGRMGVLVISILKPDGKRLFPPPANAVIMAGDRLLCVGERSSIDRLRRSGGANGARSADNGRQDV